MERYASAAHHRGHSTFAKACASAKASATRGRKPFNTTYHVSPFPSYLLPFSDIAIMTFRSALIIISCLVTSSCVAQQDSSRYSLLEAVEYLSSDELQGRGIGTEGSKLAQEYIADCFFEFGLESIDSSYSHEFAFINGILKKRVAGTNIVGLIRGTADPLKYIVVTSHYDHMGVMNSEIYNGADDNASGVGGMLSAAVYFAKNPPKHSMIFACFDGEENGLVGSRRFVEECPVPVASILLNVNMDMISRSAEDVINICGTYHDPCLKPLLDPLLEKAGVHVSFGHEKGGGPDNWTYASDHANFHKKEIPFLYFGVEDHEDYHQPTDDYEKIDHEFFVKTVDFIIAVISTLDSQL